jgi:thymidylate synthase
MFEKKLVIEARDIPDAWFQLIYNIKEYGRQYVIDLGSYEGETRTEFDYVLVDIAYPYAEPYDLMLPQMPEGMNIPNPVANGYIEQYLPYLMTDNIKENETYTYGSRISKQIEYFIDLLKITPNTNQAILQVADSDIDYFMSDPPCLRHIDMRVKNGRLYFYPYFRSWDLWNGYCANLAAIAVLQKYMSDEIGIGMGNMISSSKGLHTYGYVDELVKIRTMRNE